MGQLWLKKLSQSGTGVDTGVKKYGCCSKVGQVLQSVKIVTKWALADDTNIFKQIFLRFLTTFCLCLCHCAVFVRVIYYAIVVEA